MIFKCALAIWLPSLTVEISYVSSTGEVVSRKGLVKKYGGGGGWAGAFGNVVDKKHMTHPLPSAQK